MVAILHEYSANLSYSGALRLGGAHNSKYNNTEPFNKDTFGTSQRLSSLWLSIYYNFI